MNVFEGRHLRRGIILGRGSGYRRYGIRWCVLQERLAEYGVNIVPFQRGSLPHSFDKKGKLISAVNNGEQQIIIL